MRIFGHPLHPMLVHFPVALWSFGTACDACVLAGVMQAWPYAWGLLALGLILAIPAMLAGLIDLAGVEDDAMRDGYRHMFLMGLAWTVYLFAFITRLDGKALLPDPAVLPIALSILGFCLMMLGGWYGGQLVYHHGAGMKRTD